MPRLRFTILSFFALLAFAAAAAATYEYAADTGLPCGACHVDPGGGGALTSDGVFYGAELAKQASTGVEFTWLRLLRFSAGFLHLATAILWFGTILYVHLILKPAYAAGGLPRGEKLLGVASMVIIGITGLILTQLRLQIDPNLFASRFGYLLFIKIALYLIMVVSAVFVVLVIGPRLRGPIKGTKSLSEKRDLTPQELLQFDGKEGRPSYICHNGVIYDVSNGKLWKQGVHAGRHPAGQDLTKALILAPHGEDKLEGMPKVGRLIAVPGIPSTPLHVRVFYVMAYMNLTIAIVVIFIISLWRWW